MSKILLAEDDKLLSDSLSQALKDAGFETEQAFDGEEALAKIKAGKPDLLLLDIVMPKLDGIGVLWELKASPDTADLPVVVLTNMGDMENISKIIEAGGSDYLVKSDQSPDQIIAKVKEVLGRTAA